METHLCFYGPKIMDFTSVTLPMTQANLLWHPLHWVYNIFSILVLGTILHDGLLQSRHGCSTGYPSSSGGWQAFSSVSTTPWCWSQLGQAIFIYVGPDKVHLCSLHISSSPLIILPSHSEALVDIHHPLNISKSSVCEPEVESTGTDNSKVTM